VHYIEKCIRPINQVGLQQPYESYYLFTRPTLMYTKVCRAARKIRKDTTNLHHGGEKCFGVEKAAEPERVWSAVVAPRAKLRVALVEPRQPVAQTIRLPRYLSQQSLLSSPCTIPVY